MDMSFPNAPLCVKSELDSFKKQMVQVGIESGKYITCNPTTSIDNSSIIEYRFESGHFLRLPGIILVTHNRIIDADGRNMNLTVVKDPLEQADKDNPLEYVPSFTYTGNLAYPINYFSATQFKSIEVYINGVLVSANDNLYPYRAILELLLSYDETAQKTFLSAGLFEKDTGDLDYVDNDLIILPDKNQGAYQRWKRTNNRTFQSFSRLHSEIFSQYKALPPKTEITIRLHKHDDNFCLMSKVPVFNELEKAFLLIPQLQVTPSVREGQLATLNSGKPYILNIKKIKLYTYSNAVGKSDLSEPVIFQGQLPKRVVIAIVKANAFNGNLTSNPFKFGHHNISSIALRVDGVAYPMEEIKMDFAQDAYYLAYFLLLEGTDSCFVNNGVTITPSEFKNGHTLFVFDLSPDLHASAPFRSPKAIGKVGVDIRLHAATTESLVVLAYGEFDSEIQINKNREVSIE